MELVRVDRREVLLGAQARDVDGVLAVGEDGSSLRVLGSCAARRPLRAARRFLPFTFLSTLGRRPSIGLGRTSPTLREKIDVGIGTTVTWSVANRTCRSPPLQASKPRGWTARECSVRCLETLGV